jgi:hypothetical protein
VRQARGQAAQSGAEHACSQLSAGVGAVGEDPGEGGSEGVREWVSEGMREWVSEGVSEWVREGGRRGGGHR